MIHKINAQIIMKEIIPLLSGFTHNFLHFCKGNAVVTYFRIPESKPWSFNLQQKEGRTLLFKVCNCISLNN